MADCDFFKPEGKLNSLLDEHSLQNEFVIAYLGTAGRANHLEFLLSAAKALQQENLNVKILIAAAGSELEHFRSEVIEANLDNIIFVNYTNKEGVRQLLSVSDAVYVSFANVPILASGSPNKFFDGIASGKIVITNFEGWIKKEIETADCGFSYNGNDTNDFINKIKPYLNDISLKNSAQMNARKLAEDKFSRNGLITEWLQLFNS